MADDRPYQDTEIKCGHVFPRDFGWCGGSGRLDYYCKKCGLELSEYYVVLNIPRKRRQYHKNYIAACRELGISYKVLDISGPDWINIIKKADCDAFLVWPSAGSTKWKDMYDDKLYIMERVIGLNIFPTWKEIFLYENKRRTHYWLEANGIQHPKTWVFYNLDNVMDFIETAPLPIVLKSNTGACSSGVKILKDRKLVGVITGDKIIIALDKENTYPTDGLYLFAPKAGIHENYLIGILNSRLFVCVYRLLTLERGRVLPQVKPTILAKLPIRLIDFEKKQEKSLYELMISLTDGMFELNQKLRKAKTSQEQSVLQRQIEATDRQIDKLVYELYDLTDEEIEIVETASG